MNKKYSHNENSNKTIWVDLDNSPHVPFFAPIIRRLQEKGYNVRVSARNYSQTVELAQLHNLEFQDIGKHHGKNKFIKIIGLIYRGIQLFPFALKSKALIAISHGSRSQMIVASLLRIPIVMFLDYEYIQTLPFVKPKIVFLPNIISENKVKSIGTSVVSYPGIKEDIYVPEFQPDPTSLDVLNINKDAINIVLRPPAHEAHYHNPESEKLFDEIMKYITSMDNVHTYILPRDKRQKSSIIKKYEKHFTSGSLIIPEEVIDGLNLMWYSDLVISGGGTMNREAAALGVPVYSIFKGEIGDVDRFLAKNGRLILLDNIKDIKTKLKLVKRNRSAKVQNLNSLALQSIINNVESFIQGSNKKKSPEVKINFNDRTEHKSRKSNF